MLRVHQADLDDPPPVGLMAHRNGQVHLGRGQRERVVVLAVQPDVHLPPDGLPAPLPVRVARLVQYLRLAILSPGNRDGEYVGLGVDHAGQSHRRGPHAPEVLRRKQVGQFRVCAVTSRRQVRIDAPGFRSSRSAGLRTLPRPKTAHQVPFAWTLRARRKHLGVAVPRAEQITLDVFLQLIPHLMRIRDGELLARIKHRRICDARRSRPRYRLGHRLPLCQSDAAHHNGKARHLPSP
jgi:hypothetical protein